MAQRKAKVAEKTHAEEQEAKVERLEAEIRELRVSLPPLVGTTTKQETLLKYLSLLAYIRHSRPGHSDGIENLRCAFNSAHQVRSGKKATQQHKEAAKYQLCLACWGKLQPGGKGVWETLGSDTGGAAGGGGL